MPMVGLYGDCPIDNKNRETGNGTGVAHLLHLSSTQENNKRWKYSSIVTIIFKLFRNEKINFIRSLKHFYWIKN